MTHPNQEKKLEELRRSVVAAEERRDVDPERYREAKLAYDAYRRKMRSTPKVGPGDAVATLKTITIAGKAQ